MADIECPKCGAQMILRKGKFGWFYGCRAYPECRGTLQYNGPEIITKDQLRKPESDVKPAKYEQGVSPVVKLSDKDYSIAYVAFNKHNATEIQGKLRAGLKEIPGSDEQEAVWKSMLKDKQHIVVDSVAGSGKSFTMLQGCLRLGGSVRACTSHSLGLQIIKDNYPKIEIRKDKVMEILETQTKAPAESKEWSRILWLTKRLVSLAKNYLLDLDAPDFEEQLLRVADHHGLDLNGIGKHAVALTLPTLRECKRTCKAIIDYDDMLWVPEVCDLSVGETYDMLIIDEAQDINLSIQNLAFRSCFSGRICCVGDAHQAIYGFRGSDTESLKNMTIRLAATKRKVKQFQLTVTRRCPKLHVQMAQAIVPHIQAMEDAPLGDIQNLTEDKAAAAMKPGDLVVCRTNARLIPAAYSLIRRGIRPLIRGKDIGKGLTELINKLRKKIPMGFEEDLNQFSTELAFWRREQEDKLIPLGDKAEGRLAAMHDKVDCIMEFVHNSKTISEMVGTIDNIFADFENDGTPKNAVILGTVHRTKGLESDRVFVLAPELMPGPWAKKPWEKDQEANIAYIAVTRSKYNNKTGVQGTIIFCGQIPFIFSKTEGKEAQDGRRGRQATEQVDELNERANA